MKTLERDGLIEIYATRERLSVAMKKSPLVAWWRSPVLAR
jgi:hypothetical protein